MASADDVRNTRNLEQIATNTGLIADSLQRITTALEDLGDLVQKAYNEEFADDEEPGLTPLVPTQKQREVDAANAERLRRMSEELEGKKQGLPHGL